MRKILSFMAVYPSSSAAAQRRPIPAMLRGAAVATNRTLTVDGYLAVHFPIGHGILFRGRRALGPVEVKAETSGKLVGLYVRTGRASPKTRRTKLDDSELRADLKGKPGRNSVTGTNGSPQQDATKRAVSRSESYEACRASAAGSQSARQWSSFERNKDGNRAPFAEQAQRRRKFPAGHG